MSLPARAVVWDLLVIQAVDGAIPDDDEEILQYFRDRYKSDDAAQTAIVWRNEIRPKLEPHPGEPGMVRFVVPNGVLDSAFLTMWCTLDEDDRRSFVQSLPPR